jgi:hypothetical protein
MLNAKDSRELPINSVLLGIVSFSALLGNNLSFLFNNDWGSVKK